MASQGRGARKKGSTFELRVAKFVTEWTGTKFTRTPMSGGWAKTGDITPKDPTEMKKFMFNVECKNVEGWNFELLFDSNAKRLTSFFGKWWKQAYQDSKKSGKIPIVIFTRNRSKVFCILRKDTFNKLELFDSILNYTVVGKYRVFLFDDLLNIKYTEIVKMLKG